MMNINTAHPLSFKKKLRFFLLSELLIALALWAIASPLIWSLSLQQYKQTINSFQDYERSRIAKSALFWTFASQTDQVDTVLASKDPRAIALIPEVVEGVDVFSWDRYRLSGLTKRNRKHRELGLLATGQTPVGSTDKEQKSYRVFYNSYRIEQMPSAPSRLHPVWKRLICLELAVVFKGENIPNLVSGSVLGPDEQTSRDLLDKKQLKAAQNRFNRAFYSYFTLLRKKQESY